MEKIETYIREKIVELKNKNCKDIADTTLSQLMGFNSSYLAHLTSGKTLPSLYALQKMCNFFEITLRDFFDEEYEGAKSMEFLRHKAHDKLRPEHISKLMELLERLDSEDIENLLGICDKLMGHRLGQ